MNEVMPASDSRLLLIRIRPARETTDNAGQKLSLEAEVILNYESIYPSAPFDIDYNQLQSSIASPNNQYGQLLGAQLCAALSIQRAWRTSDSRRRFACS